MLARPKRWATVSAALVQERTLLLWTERSARTKELAGAGQCVEYAGFRTYSVREAAPARRRRPLDRARGQPASPDGDVEHALGHQEPDGEQDEAVDRQCGHS